MIASFPDRRFQLWEYRVSHGSLLIRSPRGPEFDDNIDVVFVGVEFLSIPRHLRGVELDHSTPGDRERAAAEFGDVEPHRVLVMSSEGRRHLVVAVGFRVARHHGDMFDSPFA